MDKKNFGTWFKQQREDKGLTQQQLAKLLLMGHSQEVAAIESGSVKFSHKKASLLAKAFGVPKEKIMENLKKIKAEEMDADANEFEKKFKKKGLL